MDVIENISGVLPRIGRLLDRASKWTSLSALGRVHVFRSSYFVFVFVPIAAKALDKIGPGVEFAVLGAVVHVTLGLPFSWKVFYFSSVFFGIGITLYFLFCPAIIKDFRNFTEFREEGRGQETVKRAYLDYFEARYPRARDYAFYHPELLAFLERFSGVPREALTALAEQVAREILPEARATRERVRELFSLVEFRTDRLGEAFWYVRDVSDYTSRAIRIACLYSYVAGFVLFGIVIVQNIIYVWTFTF